MFAELTTAASSIKTMGELMLLIHKTRVSEAVTEKAIQTQRGVRRTNRRPVIQWQCLEGEKWKK